MRYAIEKSEAVEIEYNNRIYKMDDSEENYQAIQKMLKSGATDKDIIAKALGEEAADEIMASKPSHKTIEQFAIVLVAAFRGVSPEEVRGSFRK